MDQNTQILLAVFGGVILLLCIGAGIFAWRSLKTAAKRRFHNEIIVQQPQPQSQFGPYGCACPPQLGPSCVPALVGEPQRPPVAIYGVAGSECCSGTSGINQVQLQQLVNTINADKAATDTQKLFENLMKLAAKQTGQA
jgi:hypothetical protein